MAINADVLDSFFVALGFQVDTEGITKFQAKYEELKGAALRLGAVAAGAAIGIGLMVEKVAESMGELQHFAELNKLSAKEVAAFNRVAADNLISNEAMESSIQSLNVKTGEAAAGVGRGRMIFQKFGLSAKDASGNTKPFSQILGDVALKMQHLSRQENLAMAQKLGLDPHLVPLLEKGKAYLDKLTGEAKAANPFSDEDYERALKVDLLFGKVKRTLGLLTSQIAVALMPAVQNALEKFLAWYKAMRSDTASTFNQTLRIMSALVGTLWNWISLAIDALTNFGRWIGKFQAATWLAKAAVAALVAYKIGTWATGAAEAVMLLVRAIFAMDGASAALNATLMGGWLLVVALIVDDLWNWYHGNESLIGQLTEKYPGALYAVGLALGVLGGAFVAMKWAALSSFAETGAIIAMYAAEWVVSFAETVALMAMYAAEWIASTWAMAAASVSSMAETAAIMAMYVWEWIASHAMMVASAVGSAAASSAAWVASAAESGAAWISSMVAAGAATWTALAPILLIVAAVGLVIAAVYLLYRNWTDIYNYIAGTWEMLKEKVDEYIAKVQGAWQKVKGFFGFGGDSKVTVQGKDSNANSVYQAPKAPVSSIAGPSRVQTLVRQGMTPDAFGPMGQGPQGRVMGVPSHHTTTSTVHNTISGNTITVVSPDPAKAGDAVMDKLQGQPSHTRTSLRNAQSGVLA